MRRIRAPLFLFLLLALNAGTPGADAQDEAAESLFLTPTGGSTGHGNFTTFPSNESQPVDQRAASTEPAANRIEWWWGLDWLPVNATIPAGSVVEVVVYVGALRNAGPTIDPVAFPDTMGGYRITAALSSGPGEPFAAGSTVLDMPVLSDASEVHEVTITFDTDTAVTLPVAPEGPGDAPVFRLVVGIDASAPDGLTPNLFVDSTETPSRLRVDGFPLDAYRAAELAARAEAECHERVLRQEACDEADVTSSEDPPAAPLLGGWPGIGFLVAMAGLSVAAVYGARRLVP